MRLNLEMLGREAPLIVSVVGLLLILAGHGESFGLPDCFWNGTLEEPGHSQRAGRLATGLAVGVFLGAAVFVWLLVESPGKSWIAAEFVRRLVIGSRYLGLAFVAVWLRWAFAHTPLTTGGALEVRWGGLLPVGVGASLIGFPLLVEWLSSHTPMALRAMAERLVPGLPPASEPLQEFHVTAAILVGLAVLVYLALVVFVGSIYPGFAICVLLIVFAGMHGFVAFRYGVAQIVAYLIAVLIYSALNASWQRARVPELEAATRSTATVSPLLSDARVLNAWKDQQVLKQGLPGLVVVAASGGGIRAALWTGVVLTALEDKWSDFPSRLRLITGASGGMLGAAEWTATLPDAPERRLHSQPSRNRVLDGLECGGLKAVASGLVLRDLLPPPLRLRQDRGRRLEEAWESYSPVLAQPLHSLAGGEEGGQRPSLVLTPTIVEDGRFLVISNLDLAPLLRSEGPQRPSTTNTLYAVHGFQLFDYLPDAWYTLRLSTAVRLQANFPYVLPATEVPGPKSGHIRVVDAGYRDDWGVGLASSWIAWNRDWLAKNTSGVLLIQIRDAPSRGTAPPSGKRGFLARGMDGLATPLFGLASAWEHTAAARNDEMVDELARTMNQHAEKPVFATVIFDLEPQVAPLTWSLTTAEAKSIRSGLSSANNEAALNGFGTWAVAH